MKHSTKCQLLPSLFSVIQFFSFFRDVPSFFDNITITPMSLVTKQKTAVARNSLSPLSDIEIALRSSSEKAFFFYATILLLQRSIVEQFFNKVLQ